MNLIRPSATGNMNSPFLGKYYFHFIGSFRVDFRCVHRFQLLNVCNHYVTLPNSHRVHFLSKLMNSWLVFRRDRVILNQWTNRGWLVLQKVLQNVFRMESSHQTRDLECFADKWSIPWNLPTIFHPDMTATVPKTYLLSLCALLSQQAHLFVICGGVEVQWFQERSSQVLPNSKELSA